MPTASSELVTGLESEVFLRYLSQAATRVVERTTAEGGGLVPVQYQAPRQVRFGVRYSF